MRPKVKRLWLSALESDAFKFNKHGYLRLDDEFSVLGVLCHLVRKKVGLLWIADRPNGTMESFQQMYKMQGQLRVLPPLVAEYVGLPLTPMFKIKLYDNWTMVPATEINTYRSQERFIRLIRKQL